VIFIGYTVAGLFIDQVPAAERMYQRLDGILGPETAEFIQNSISAIGNSSSGGTLPGSLVSYAALLAAASGLFFQLQYALNRM
jgi:uncharacterized BrkB/YihY/UPF0761 family membrane protein